MLARQSLQKEVTRLEADLKACRDKLDPRKDALGKAKESTRAEQRLQQEVARLEAELKACNDKLELQKEVATSGYANTMQDETILGLKDVEARWQELSENARRALTLEARTLNPSKEPLICRHCMCA